MMEKSTAKNSVVSSAPRIELITPLPEKFLAEVCARWAKSAAPAWRLRLRQEAAVKTGADFRVRNTAAGAVCQQIFHGARCKCRWRFDRRADRDFRETLQNPRAQQGA